MTIDERVAKYAQKLRAAETAKESAKAAWRVKATDIVTSFESAPASVRKELKTALARFEAFGNGVAYTPKGGKAE